MKKNILLWIMLGLIIPNSCKLNSEMQRNKICNEIEIGTFNFDESMNSDVFYRKLIINLLIEAIKKKSKLSIYDRSKAFDTLSAYEDEIGSSNNTNNSNHLIPRETCYYLKGKMHRTTTNKINITCEIFYLRGSSLVASASEEFPANVQYNKIKQIVYSLVETMLKQLYGDQEKQKVKIKITGPQNYSISIGTRKYNYDKPNIDIDFFPGFNTILIEPADGSFFERKIETFVLEKNAKKKEVKIELKKKKVSLYFTPHDSQSLFYIDGIKFAGKESAYTPGNHQFMKITESGDILKTKIFIEPDKKNEIDSTQLNSTLIYKVKNLIMSYKKNSIAEQLIEGEAVDDYLYIVKMDGTLEAINSFSHHNMWFFNKYWVVGKPILINNRLFVFCKEEHYNKTIYYYHRIIELDRKNGAILWQSRKILSNWPKAIIRDNHVLFAFDQKTIFFLKNERNEVVREPYKISISKLKRKYPSKYNWDWIDISRSKLLVLDSDQKKLTAFTINIENKKCEFMFFSNYPRKNRIKDYRILGDYAILLESKSIRILNLKNENLIDLENPINEMPSKYKYDNLNLIRYHNKTYYIFMKNLNYLKIFLSSNKPKFEHVILRLPENVVLNDVVITPSDDFLLLDRAHNVLFYDTTINATTWKYTLKSPVKFLSAEKKYFCVGSIDGEVITCGYPKFKNIAGWVENIIDNQITIRLCKNKSLSMDRDFFIINADDIVKSFETDTMPQRCFRIQLASSPKVLNTGIVESKFILDENEYKSGFLNIKEGDLIMYTGFLKFNKNLSNNIKFINNSYIGNSSQAPQLFSNIKFGSDRISLYDIEKNEWLLYNKILTKDFNINYELSKSSDKSFQFIINTIPSNANIFVNGKEIGAIPKIFSDIVFNQTIDIYIKKKGFKSIKDRIKITKEDEKKVYQLRFKKNFLDCGPLIRINKSSPVIGLRDGYITQNNAKGKTLIFEEPWIQKGLDLRWEFSSEKLKIGKLNLGRLSFFARLFLNSGSISSHEFWTDFYQNDRTEMGIKLFINKFPIVGEASVGISKLKEELEGWDDSVHRYKDVNFKRHLVGHLYFRPKHWLNFELSFGGLLKGYFGGSYGENNKFSYIQAESGNFLNLIGIISIYWKNLEALKILGSYQYRKTNYGIAKESGSTFEIGIYSPMIEIVKSLYNIFFQ
jgi:hypothetical protein